MPYNTIVLRGDLSRYHDEARVEPTKTIMPGMLIEVLANGNVQPHATASGNQEYYFAKEDAKQGRTIDNAYNDSTFNLCSYHKGQRSDRIYALIPNGANIANEARLRSNGDGTLAAVAGTETDTKVVGIAKEAVNNTSGANARIQIELV